MSLSYLTLLLEECLQHMFEKLQFDAQQVSGDWKYLMILIASPALVTITMGLISYFSTLISHGQVMMSVRVILLALLSLSLSAYT